MEKLLSSADTSGNTNLGNHSSSNAGIEEKRAEPRRIVNYVVGLGGTGSIIVSRFAELNRRRIGVPSPEEKMKGVGRADITSVINIIDMVVEPELRDAINRGILRRGDDAIIGGEILPPEAYDLDIIKNTFGKYYMPSFLRYHSIISSEIRLQAGGGTSRYRPLARYFIHYGWSEVDKPFLQTIMHDITARDFIDKIKRDIRARDLNVIYTLSLGGGFGSGSILDVHAAVSVAAKQIDMNIKNTFLNLLIPVGYRITPDKADLVWGRIDYSRASAAAALLELLYVASKEIHGYTDDLIKTVPEVVGLTEKIPLKLDNLKIFVASYTNVVGSNIDEIYDEIDDKAALLNTVITHILPDLMTDVQEWQQIFPQIGAIISRDTKEVVGIVPEGCLNYVPKASTLLTPVAVYNAKIVKMNYKGVVTQELQRLVDELSELEIELKAKQKEKDELRQKLNILMGDLEKAKNLLKQLTIDDKEIDSYKKNMLRVEGLIADIAGVKGIIDRAVVEKDWKVKKEHIKKADEQWKTIQSSISTFIGNIDEYIDKYRIIKGVLRNIAERKSESLESLSRAVNEITGKREDMNSMSIKEYYVLLLATERALSDIITNIRIIKSNIDIIKERASKECGLFATLIMSPQCSVKSKASDLSAEVVGQHDTLVAKLHTVNGIIKTIASAIENIRDNINKIISSLETGINNINSELTELEKEIASIANQIERKKADLNVYRREIANNIMRKNEFIPASLANMISHDIIEGLRKGEIKIEKGKLIIRGKNYKNLLTINGLRSRYGEHASSIKEVITNIRNIIMEAVSGMNRYLANIDTLRPQVREGWRRVQHIYIVVSKDEDQLLTEEGIKEWIERFRSPNRIAKYYVLDHIDGSLLGIVSVVYNVPLLHIKEIRTMLNSYAEKVRRVVYSVDKVREGVYKAGKTIEVNERKGEIYHAIDPELNKEFKEFIEAAISLVKCYEELKE